MAKIKKNRWFTIQRNYDFETHDAQKNVVWDITEDEWRDAMTKFFRDGVDSGEFITVSLIFHDRDVIDTGFKPLHLHAIVQLKSPVVDGRIVVDDKGNIVKRTGAMLILGASKAENMSPLAKAGERGAMAQYDLHITAKAISARKHIYSEDDVILMGDISDYHDLLKLAGTGNKLDDNDAFGVSLRTKIWRGEIRADDTLDLIFDKIGKDDPILAQQIYDKNREYYEKAEELYGNRLAAKQRKHRNMTPIYISGSGGSGKTSLAVALGRLVDRVREPYVTPPPADGVTYDLADGYHYEKVAVVDDLEPTRFAPLGFTGMFDHSQYKMSSARNKNKHFLPDVAFISIERDLERYISEMLIYSKGGANYSSKWSGAPWERHPALNSEVATIDLYHQIERRISYVILINGNATAGDMTINVFEFIAKSKETADRYKLIAKNIPWRNINYRQISISEEVAIEDDDKKIHDGAVNEIYTLLFENFNRPDLGHYENVYRDMEL